jgi:hypothetical protein
VPFTKLLLVFSQPLLFQPLPSLPGRVIRLTVEPFHGLFSLFPHFCLFHVDQLIIVPSLHPISVFQFLPPVFFPQAIPFL